MCGLVYLFTGGVDCENLVCSVPMGDGALHRGSFRGDDIVAPHDESDGNDMGTNPRWWAEVAEAQGLGDSKDDGTGRPVYARVSYK